MQPAKKHITRLLPYLLYGISSLSVIAAGCKKNDEALLSASPEIKMEMIPANDTIRQVIASNTLLTASHPWYIDGWVYVTNEATLRLEAGTIIKILPSAVNKETGRHSGGLIIGRGAYIHAAGTATLPVHVVVEKAISNGGAGIIVLGKAAPSGKNNLLDNPDDPSVSHLAYGGDAPDDSSGVIKHLYIDYYPANGTGFRGGLLLLGTGSRTIVDHIIIHPLPMKKSELKTTGLLKKVD
ncbi:hypothetical protein ACTJJ0_11885 [Chitinophaga sp. 22321]|uniref:Right handed beta helix region n=1 Tax=Chitinophaga hostae TaxID=2831022 RepID=A0ABS5IWH0_9BACT|nr:hypothetical protein [Chitinophaga hostae]MBS0027307.1 hypothetical protein [Chitinophaga hostae]